MFPTRWYYPTIEWYPNRPIMFSTRWYFPTAEWYSNQMIFQPPNDIPTSWYPNRPIMFPTRWYSNHRMIFQPADIPTIEWYSTHIMILQLENYWGFSQNRWFLKQNGHFFARSSRRIYRILSNVQDIRRKWAKIGPFSPNISGPFLWLPNLKNEF